MDDTRSSLRSVSGLAHRAHLRTLLGSEDFDVEAHLAELESERARRRTAENELTELKARLKGILG